MRQNTKLIVPQAPKLSLSALPHEADQEAWFDVLSESMDAARDRPGERYEEDEAGIEEVRTEAEGAKAEAEAADSPLQLNFALHPLLLSALSQATGRVHALLDHELSSSGLESHHLFLGGFGHGAALALHAALTYPKRLGGVVSLAGYVPLPDSLPQRIEEANAKLPLLVLHGNSDFVIPWAFAKARYELLRAVGVPIQTRNEWNQGHFMSNASIMATQNWIRHCFNKADESDQQTKK